MLSAVIVTSKGSPARGVNVAGVTEKNSGERAAVPVVGGVVADVGGAIVPSGAESVVVVFDAESVVALAVSAGSVVALAVSAGSVVALAVRVVMVVPVDVVVAGEVPETLPEPTVISLALPTAPE